jgi:glutamine kinase
MNAFRFGTKAQTLAILQPLLTQAVILDVVSFTVADWQAHPDACLEKIANLGEVRLAVRSSALAEDGEGQSNAGAYASRLHVDGAMRDELVCAIHDVVASMTGTPLDEVLVQPMAEDVVVSGVIMTFDVMHGAPYYVINYDDESGATDSVTGGRGVSKALLVYRGADASYIQSPRIARFLDLARELERCCGTNALDIEFGLTADQTLVLFQVRRIATAGGWHPVTERRVARQLAQVARYIQAQMQPQAHLLGRRTMFAIMPDWNPAEILGTTPRPLALSLYRYLITASTWREARAAMAYAKLPPVELMVALNSHPYIDVRASFNSFLPAGLPQEVGARLVDAWLDRLENHPELHDKVEFEVAQTCYTFTFTEDWKARFADVLPAQDLPVFAQAAQSLTRSLLDLSPAGSLAKACSQARELQSTYERVEADAGALQTACRLIRTCREQGALPFAIVARHAFVAEALLRSAVQRGALSDARLWQFKRSIRTITSDLLVQHDAVCRGQADPADFLVRFGHLRPGTYDITSLRYDERDGLFLGLGLGATPGDASFVAEPAEIAALTALLEESGLSDQGGAFLLDYARQAIAAREEVKFIFTKVLSDILALLVSWGETQGLSRSDLSFLRWDDIERLIFEPPVDDPDRLLLALARDGEQHFNEANAFYLSHIVRGIKDVYVATLHRSVANFVGTTAVTAPVMVLDAHATANINLYGKIVCIENADPGFDWIFTRGVAGLITKFGGANSHMAIRCAELGLPAAIGCGEQSFERIVRAGSVELDVPGRILRPLHGAE